MTFLEFVESRQQNKIKESRLDEAFKTEDFNKVFKLIISLLKKNIDKKVFFYDNVWTILLNKEKYKSYMIFFQENGEKFPTQALSINYTLEAGAKSFDPYSVSFFDKEQTSKLLYNDEGVKANLEINFMGASLIYYLPVIYHVINTNDYSLAESKIKNLAGKVYDKDVKESYHNFYIGAQTYRIYENITSERLIENYKIISEIKNRNNYVNRDNKQTNNIMESDLQKQKEEVYGRLKQSRIDGDRDLERELYKEYRKILNAIKGGATDIDDLKIATKKNVRVEVEEEDSTADARKRFNKGFKDPEQAFKEMKAYVSSVIKGLQPGVILCGAPGVGKSYRVMQQLRAAGYSEMKGNLEVIKGKCTARQIYLQMYLHKNKGEVLVIDDADSLVGPKAPEDVINLLKGALDSTTDDEGGRTVSYRVTGDLKDDDGTPIPKKMSYHGSVIVITNYNVGQLDSALKGRVFTQSLDFTTTQLLEIIKKLMPAIEPTKLSPKSKMQAYEYLTEMAEKGEDMEISIRTFAMCARIFQLTEYTENDLSIDEAKDMVAEQMWNNYKKSGKKY